MGGKSLVNVLAVAAAALPITPVFAEQQPATYRDRLAEDEVIYLIMPDRFENGDPSNDRANSQGGRSRTGFDPTDKAFYHGGDIRGVIDRLDYIQGLGATALWLTPVFTNKWVQGTGVSQSAGYHGYWIRDFLGIDPHLGTRDEYRTLVEAAHRRGMKVYLDIVVNHTADVIRYRDCTQDICPYRPLAQKPYTPSVPDSEAAAKSPAWLNDPVLYHNRGESTFKGESSLNGDFVGLDDVKTEDPQVIGGFIDIYGHWIDELMIDGFRVDTAKHVNPEFWQAFIPAMLDRARTRGIPNFHIFGEVMEFEPKVLAHYTHVDGFPAVNDFALHSAIVDVIAKNGPTNRLAEVFRADDNYRGGEDAARTLVTLVSNHDVRRIGRAIRVNNPQATESEILSRAILANAVILHSRGVPALYYGDEQGFIGDGDIDQDSREDMFASRVASYNDDRLIGVASISGKSHFDPGHPLYRAITEMTHRRALDPTLRRGRQVTRLAGDSPGLFAFSRLLDGAGETLVVLNTSRSERSARVSVEPSSLHWNAVRGVCPEAVTSGGYEVKVGPLDYIVCRSEGPLRK